VLMLTEGSNWLEKQRRVVGGEAERRGRAALAEEDDAGASVLLVTVDRLVEILRRSYGD
jgi:hypothetical protein